MTSAEGEPGGLPHLPAAGRCGAPGEIDMIRVECHYSCCMAHIDKSDRGESAFRVRVNANGRIVIPASVRRELGVEAGDEILLEKRDDVFWITTQQQRIARAQERARRLIGSGPSMSAELIAERREAARRE